MERPRGSGDMDVAVDSPLHVGLTPRRSLSMRLALGVIPAARPVTE